MRALPPLPSPDERRALLDALTASLAKLPRPVRIVKKGDAWHQRLAGTLLWALTLGGQDRYLTSYVTTLGHTIYVPNDWDEWEPGGRWAVLRHELVHVRQFERWGWPMMVLLYGLVPFPVGLAYFRARFELEGYEESMRARAELDGLEAALSRPYRDELVRRFTGPDYAWMWPLRGQVERWLAEAAQRVAAEYEGRRAT